MEWNLLRGDEGLDPSVVFQLAPYTKVSFSLKIKYDTEKVNLTRLTEGFSFATLRTSLLKRFNPFFSNESVEKNCERAPSPAVLPFLDGRPLIS